MMLIQYVSLGGSLIFLLIVFLTIYRGALREGYALLWIFVTLGMIFLSIVPKLLDLAAALVGIRTPAFVLLLFMLGGILLLLMQQSIVISKHNEKIKRLTEELALLQEDIQRKSSGKEQP